MSSTSSLKIKSVALLLIYLPSLCFADPEVAGELLPPGEAMYVTDPSILNNLNLGPDGEPVWCYSNLANSLIVSSADREREKCKLKLSQELEKMSERYKFEIEILNVEIGTLKSTNEEVLKIKNNEIEKLTMAVAKKPADYTHWWVAGSFFTGVVTTIGVFLLLK